ncbi:RHS repeat-associated core domain-containing protein [Clostridium sp. YIM B02565]|uniref:RHS repeat-associated core domain-containing protein n=1 Tax=Clostridium paridis TaxID=2803863 RepID=A0A937FHX7_9CLOT|nr:RHS repeat-associated core domain-containing protein [Clostridium paridis]
MATGTKVYQYGDTNWKDKLTNYNGKAITYDAIGNPLTYDGNTYTWDRGRTLTGITGNGKTISFKYNDSGIRTEKNVNGVVSKYTLNGDKVVYEEVTNGSAVDKIYYTYDASSNLISIKLNGTEYFYVRNGQGDIIGLVDTNGTQVVSYSYDSWGKLVSIDGTLKDTLGVKNPYRYRGYRYDTETGMYYLNSRYYNPDWGRFINADALGGNVGELLSHNIFAYCKNNPVNMQDPNGYRYSIIDGGVQDDIYMGRANKIENPYDWAANARKNTISGAADSAGEGLTKNLATGAKKWVSLEYLAMGKYVKEVTTRDMAIKGTVGKAGALYFTGKDVVGDVKKKEYFGVGVDLTAGALGVGASYGLGVLGNIAIAAACPGLLVVGGVFILGVGAAMLIDYGANEIKNKYYRRD